MLKGVEPEGRRDQFDERRRAPAGGAGGGHRVLSTPLYKTNLQVE